MRNIKIVLRATLVVAIVVAGLSVRVNAQTGFDLFNLRDQADIYCKSIAGQADNGSETYDTCIRNYSANIDTICDPGSMSIAQCQSSVEESLDELYSSPGEGSGSGASFPTAGGTNGSPITLEPIQFEGNFQQCGTDASGDPIYVAIGVDCDPNENPIISYATAIINFLAGIVGVVVAIMVAVAGVQYITSRGRPDQIEIAKKKLTNALIALGTYLLLYAILQWIIPGGALSG